MSLGYGSIYTLLADLRDRYGFTEADFDRPIFIDNVLGRDTATLREIMGILRATYCGPIGVEFMHIQDPAQKAWVQERIESIRNRIVKAGESFDIIAHSENDDAHLRTTGGDLGPAIQKGSALPVESSQVSTRLWNSGAMPASAPARASGPMNLFSGT